MDSPAQHQAHTLQEHHQRHQQQQQERHAPSWRVTYLLQSGNSSNGWRKHKSPHEVLIQPDMISDNNNGSNRRHHLVVRDALSTSRVQERVPLGNGVESLLQAAYVVAADGNSIVRFEVGGRAVKKFAVITDSGRSAAELCQALDRRGVRVRGMEELPDVVFLRGDDQRSSDALEANIPNLSRPEVQAYIVRLLFQDSFHDFVRDLSEMFSHVQSHIPLLPVPGSSEHTPAAGGLVPTPAETATTLIGTAMAPTLTTALTESGTPSDFSVTAVALNHPEDRCHQSIETGGVSRRTYDSCTVGISTSGKENGCIAGDRVERGAGEGGENSDDTIDQIPGRKKSLPTGKEGPGNLPDRGRGSVLRGGSGRRGRGRLGGGRGGGIGGRRGRGTNTKDAVRGERGNYRACVTQDNQDIRGGAKESKLNETQKKRPAETECDGNPSGKLRRNAISQHSRSELGGADIIAFGSTTTADGLDAFSGEQQQRPSEAAVRSISSEPVPSSTSGKAVERSQVPQLTAVGHQANTASDLSPRLGPNSKDHCPENRLTERKGSLARALKPKRPIGGQVPTRQSKPIAGRTTEGRMGTQNAGRANSVVEPTGAKRSGTKPPRDTEKIYWKKDNATRAIAEETRAVGRSKDSGVGGQRWRIGMPIPVVAPTTSGRMAGLSATLTHIWSEVNKHPSAWPFCKAVDLAGAPDYLEVVKHPIDLSSIWERLKGAIVHYTSKEMLYDDLVLMCRNAMLYFHKDTDFHRAAKQLLQFIESTFSP